MKAELLYRRSPAWLQSILMNIHAVGIERHRYGSQFRREFAQAVSREGQAAAELAEYQLARIREVIRVAYERTIYYRDVMDAAKVRPSDIRSLSDLQLLPLLFKETAKARADDLSVAGSRAGWMHGHTSGTTGSPLSLWYDRHTCVMTNVMDWRQKAWGGMQRGDWVGLFLGRVIVSPDRREPPYWKANFVQRQVWFSSFHLDDEGLGAIVAEVRRRGLRFLEGYPSTLYILAAYLRRQGEMLPMRAVFTSSETLHGIQRELIEDRFACRVFDFYGLAERVAFAIECEHHQGKHLCEDFGYTEIVDEDGQAVPPGRVGYLVGTSLHNVATPMIRYRTSDLSAIMEDHCGCGRTMRRIRSITTKAEDVVITPDGRMISPSVLTHPFKPLTQIRESQIIQERLNRIVVKVVPAAPFTEQDRRTLVQGLRERLGSEMEIETTVVDSIPREPSGKFRWVISKLDHDCRFQWESSSRSSLE